MEETKPISVTDYDITAQAEEKKANYVKRLPKEKYQKRNVRNRAQKGRGEQKDGKEKKKKTTRKSR